MRPPNHSLHPRWIKQPPGQIAHAMDDSENIQGVVVESVEDKMLTESTFHADAA